MKSKLFSVLYCVVLYYLKSSSKCFLRGATITGRLPPTRFIKKRKTAIDVDLNKYFYVHILAQKQSGANTKRSGLTEDQG